MEFESVQARGLVKVFGATRALAGVDLDLRAGQVTVVAGHNGSGKSTLLSLLLRPRPLCHPSASSLHCHRHPSMAAIRPAATWRPMAWASCIYHGFELLEVPIVRKGMRQVQVSGIPQPVCQWVY